MEGANGIVTLEDLKRYQYKTILLQRIGMANWSSEPIDLKSRYLEEFGSRSGGTIMPPSPGTMSYNLRYLMGPDKTTFCATFKFRKGFKQLLRIIKETQPEQLYHRSRQFTLAVSKYRGHEIDHRLEIIKENKEEIDQKRMPESLAHESFEIVFSRLRKHLDLDPEWISKYIHEHRKSSTGEGLKWDSLSTLLPEDWAEIYNAISGIIEETYANEGNYLQTKFYTGLRARSPRLAHTGEEQCGEVDRTRIIAFHPSFSLWAMFLPHKKQWYKETMNDLTDLFGLDASSVHLPLVEGGQVYTHAADLMDQGLNYFAYDGKSWDAMVGLIGGKSWYSVLTPIDVPMLPSGITLTSLLDTLISLYYYSKYMRGEEVVILGDDVNIFAKKKPYAGDNIMEYQPMDTKLKFLLGVSYYRNTRLPRLQGVKLTTDRGDKNIAIPGAWNDEGSKEVFGHHPTSTQGLWYGLHFGYFGHRSLLDAISKIPSEEYRGPTEMIHQLAESKDPEVVTQALEWIEQAEEVEHYAEEDFKGIEQWT